MLSSTGSSSCSKIVQARSLLTCGMLGLLDDRAEEAVGVATAVPWMPIREPIVPDSALKARVRLPMRHRGDREGGVDAVALGVDGLHRPG